MPSFGNYTWYLLFLVWNARGRIWEIWNWVCDYVRSPVWECFFRMCSGNSHEMTLTEIGCWQNVSRSYSKRTGRWEHFHKAGNAAWVNKWGCTNVSFEFTFFLYHLPQMMVFNMGKNPEGPKNSEVFCFLMLELFITFFVPSLFWVCFPYFILGTVWEKYLETPYVPKQRGRLARISEASVWSVHQARTCRTNLIYSESAGFSNRFGS